MKRLLFAVFLLVGLTAHGQRFVKSQSTIPEALSANPNDIHSNLWINGRTSANDGGGGPFTYNKSSTATTNAGITWALPSYSGRIIRQVPDPNEVNAAWFGAKPGDDADDSVAIQAALDYCYLQKHGTVRLNAGLYDMANTLYIPYRVNLVGAPGFKFTELTSRSSSSDLYMLGGSTQLRMLDNRNLYAMVVMNSTDGYIRQAGEVIEDGSVVTSRFQETLVENIVFVGNAVNNTASHTHGIVAFNKWNITVHNCGFINLNGNSMYWRDCNGLLVDSIWMKGQIGQRHNSGMWVYSCADSIFSKFWAFGFQGPCIWVNGGTSALNMFSDMLLGNSVVSNTVHQVTSVSSGQWTLAGSPWFETGDHVELRTTGTVPTGFSRVGLYYLYKVSAGVYGMHTNYSLATNGVYLTTVDSGTGTHYVTKGPASAVYLSGAANNNSFVNIRADQCSGPGFYMRDAYANVFTGGLISQCDGAANLETIPDYDKVGVRFDLYAQQNGLVNTTIRFTPIGVQTTNNAYGNLIMPRNYFVTTLVDRGADSANDEPVIASGYQATIGSATNQVTLNLIGNASGVRLLKMIRADITQTNGLGVQTDGFTFWNETGGRAVGSWIGSSSQSLLKLGSSSATPRTAVLSGETATGTDTGSPDMQFWSGLGTGNSTTGGDFTFFTPDATTSGAGGQGVSSKFRIRRQGQLNFMNFTSDPTVRLGAGDMWFRADLNKFRVRYSASTENLATETYVNAAISGSGALTDGDKGDITVSGTGTVFTIDNSAVTYAKMQNVSAVSKLLGRNSSTTGPPEEITLGAGLTMTGSTLSASGGGGGSGDVVGPASATDNAIARFDTTTGKLIQNSAATVADTTGDITAGKYNGVTISGSSTPSIAVTGTTTISGTHSGTSSGSNTGDQTITLTSDVTGSGTGSFATTISSGAVTYSKMQNVSAASKLLGRGSAAGAGSPQEITIGAGLTMSGTTLTASGATVADSDYGDITVSGSGTAWNIDLSAVTYDKIQDMNHTRMLGRKTANGIGAPEEITVSDALDWTSGTTPAFGDVLYRGASSWSRLAPGTSGQFLQTQGTGASPQWTTPSIAGSALTGSSLAAGITSSSLTSFGSSPTLTTPNIGVATATSVNKVAITAPATSATLTIANGKTLTVNNTVTLAGTDSTTYTLPDISADIGFRNVPQNSQSAAYTLVLADSGKHIFHPSTDANSRTFTIPANGTVAFAIGTTITFYNASANSCTIAITTDTLRKAGTGTTGSVTLPQYALATIMKVTTTEWVISGNGI
jgi:hypothetical protein